MQKQMSEIQSTGFDGDFSRQQRSAAADWSIKIKASLMSVTKLSAGEGDHENFGPRRIGEREQSIARPRTRSPSVVGECSTLEIDERRLRHVVPEQHPERIWIGLAIPGFKGGERTDCIGNRCIAVAGRRRRKRSLSQ
jgi:hypothetical protein